MINLPILFESSRLLVTQRKEMMEVFTGLETKNRYAVQTESGQDAFFVAELGEGAGAFFARFFLKNRRPFKMNIMNPTGGVELFLHRPWTWFFSKLHISDAQGNLIGTIQQRFKIIGRLFDVHDSLGRTQMTIEGPLFRPWTFKVIKGGVESGLISKKWSGLLKESFTDADNFGVEFGSNFSNDERALTLAATFLIDFLYFENSSPLQTCVLW